MLLFIHNRQSTGLLSNIEDAMGCDILADSPKWYFDNHNIILMESIECCLITNQNNFLIDSLEEVARSVFQLWIGAQ